MVNRKVNEINQTFKMNYMIWFTRQSNMHELSTIFNQIVNNSRFSSSFQLQRKWDTCVDGQDNNIPVHYIFIKYFETHGQ